MQLRFVTVCIVLVMYCVMVRFLLAFTGEPLMDPGFSSMFASIACGTASIGVVLSLWLLIRLSKLESNFATLDDKLPPKRIRELEQGFDSMTDAFETHQQKNQAWKQSVHNSVQRMDQIMRRNEQTGGQVLTEKGELNEDVVKGELPAELTTATPDPVAMSKQQALRFRFNKNRGI